MDWLEQEYAQGNMVLNNYGIIMSFFAKKNLKMFLSNIPGSKTNSQPARLLSLNEETTPLQSRAMPLLVRMPIMGLVCPRMRFSP